MRDITHINGPVNVARLEGEVNGVKKILYLFMDIHYDLHQETKCNSKLDKLTDPIKSKNIIDLMKDLIDEHKNNKKEYDLFIELYDTSVKDKSSVAVLRGRYIDEIGDIFKELFNFVVVKGKNKKNTIKVKTNKEYSNFRWHYFDIRGRLKIFDVYYESSKYIFDFSKPDKQIHYINKIIKELKKTRDGIYYNSKNLDKEFLKHLNKITSVYKDGKIQSVLNNELKNIGFKLNKSIELYSDSILRLERERRTKRDEEKIQNNLYEAYDLMELYFASFVDLITLRRVLDKDYINTVFHYAGAYHASFIIKVLVNNFGFKITHISKTNPKQDVRKVKKFKSTDDVYYRIISSRVTQCSRISDFPKLLT